MTFKPACICRELDAVLVYCPKDAEVRVFVKPERFVWLKTLNTSQRNWSVNLSVIFVFLSMAQSNSWKLARGKAFRPRVPGLPSNGCVNGKPLLSVQMVAALEDVLTPRVQRLGIKAAAALPAATA